LLASVGDDQTSDILLARISNDGGETFGPILRLASNGTITTVEGNTTATEEWGE
jgi:hypothetical protein